MNAYALALLALLAPAAPLCAQGISVSNPDAGGVNGTSISPSDVTTSTLTVNVNTIKTADGKVGIGTASPGSKLHLSSGSFTMDGNAGSLSVITGQATSITADGNIRGNGFIPSVAANNTPGSGIQFRGSGGEWYMRSPVTGAGFALDILNAPQTAAFNTLKISNVGDWNIGSSTVSIISASGNVGIGTASPLVKLQVEGSAATNSATIQGLNGSAPSDNQTRVFLTGNSVGTNNPQGCIQFGEYTNYSHSGICGVATATSGNTTGGIGIYSRPVAASTTLTQYALINSSGAVFGSYVAPPSYTSAQLSPGGAAPTPQSVGMTVFNSTIKDTCVSTAAVSGAWALAGSKGATGCF